jgi:hypothetical protein
MQPARGMCLSLKGRFTLRSESFFMTLLYSPKKHQRRRVLKSSTPLFFRQMAHVASTGVCGLAPLPPVSRAARQYWLCGDRLCRPGPDRAPKGCPGPPARACHERPGALLRWECPAGVSTDGLAVSSLRACHCSAHRCASQPTRRRSRVDVVETSGEGRGSISTLVSILPLSTPLLNPAPQNVPGKSLLPRMYCSRHYLD